MNVIFQLPSTPSFFVVAAATATKPTTIAKMPANNRMRMGVPFS
jgi:hypothetical protein